MGLYVSNCQRLWYLTSDCHQHRKHPESSYLIKTHADIVAAKTFRNLDELMHIPLGVGNRISVPVNQLPFFLAHIHHSPRLIQSRDQPFRLFHLR